MRLRLPRRRRADFIDRTNPSASIAARTLSRVRSLTWSGWLSTLDTVPSETPARAVTSFMLGLVEPVTDDLLDDCPPVLVESLVVPRF